MPGDTVTPVARRSRPVRECRRQPASYYESRKLLAAYYASPARGFITTPPSWETRIPDTPRLLNSPSSVIPDTQSSVIPETQSLCQTVTTNIGLSTDSITVVSSESTMPSLLPEVADVNTPSDASSLLVTSAMMPPPEDTNEMHKRTVSELILANKKIEELSKQITDLKAKQIVDMVVKSVQICPSSLVQQSSSIQNTSTTTNKAEREMLLFRASGRLQVLSNFCMHNICIDGLKFRSAEHAYQYKKALYHNRRDVALRILHSKTPLIAKKISKNIIQCSQWHESKADIMMKILHEKAKQYPVFSRAVINTGNKHLIHNTETDSFWGCGEDFKGQNMLGSLLEDLRTYLVLQLPSATSTKHTPHSTGIPSTTSTISNIHATVCPKPQVLVLGNSNSRGIAQGLMDRGLEASGFCYPGGTIPHITSRVRHTKSRTDPNFILLMAGDIDAANGLSAENICVQYDQLIRETRRTFPFARIILSGLPQSGCDMRQVTIRKLNYHLEAVANDERLVEFVNNTHAKLRDHIHLSRTSKEKLCMHVAHVAKKVFL